MKRFLLKLPLYIALIILSGAIVFGVYYLIVTAGVNLEEEKLLDLKSSVEICDDSGASVTNFSGGKTVTEFKDIPQNLINAFIATEDKRFYSHNGVDIRGIARAVFNDIKSFSFKEGASTITQQLIKNTHLSNDKTVNRKLKEIKLALELERRYTKDMILETYLNTVYFGNGCYGVTSACERFFGIRPEELSLAQCAALAGTVKAPSRYSPASSLEKNNERKNVVLKSMKEQNYITDSEYKNAVSETVTSIKDGNDTEKTYFSLVLKEIDGILGDFPYDKGKIKVYTFYSPVLQHGLDEIEESEYDFKLLITDKENRIMAYRATVTDGNRQTGSTLKPLCVYAPAIETDSLDICTPVLDEKVNIGGYSPSNYKDLYYGYVSAKESLAKSLNSVAVKILDSVGVNRALSYLKNTDIPVTDKEELCAALGVTKKGADFISISCAYSLFMNNGYYVTPKTVKRIETEKGTLYRYVKEEKKVFGADTCFLISEMLKETVKTGTAKKLAHIDQPVCAKTGTVGTSSGNTDAYCVSYDGNYTVSAWSGSKSGLMPNSVAGGTLPARNVSTIREHMITNGFNGRDIAKPPTVLLADIDRISYQKDKAVLLADKNSPKRYVLSEYFKISRLPVLRSDRFSSPSFISATAENGENTVTIRIKAEEYCDYAVYKNVMGKPKTLIYDSGVSGKTDEITDADISDGLFCVYSAIPYVTGKNGVIKGEEIFFPEFKKIKLPFKRLNGVFG